MSPFFRGLGQAKVVSSDSRKFIVSNSSVSLETGQTLTLIKSYQGMKGILNVRFAQSLQIYAHAALEKYA